MNPTEYFRTFQLGKLYFKFIKGSELEKNGWTGDALAKLLAKWGLIGLTNLQKHEVDGTWSKGSVVYYELPGRQIKRSELIQMVLSQCPQPPGMLRGLFRKESL